MPLFVSESASAFSNITSKYSCSVGVRARSSYDALTIRSARSLRIEILWLKSLDIPFRVRYYIMVVRLAQKDFTKSREIVSYSNTSTSSGAFVPDSPELNSTRPGAPSSVFFTIHP